MHLCDDLGVALALEKLEGHLPQFQFLNGFGCSPHED